MSKLFDWVILTKCADVLGTNELQFGFKPQSSTAKCTFALMETINYFQENNSNVYVLLLDASKAFDKINYVKLFNLLMEREMNPMLIRCLIYMYTHQNVNVSWNNSMSSFFTTSNGVKQGGVLSPILFSVYIDEMLNRLSRSGFGCMIGHEYYGAFGYADDVSLVAPSAYALNKMCDICLEFASEYDLQFNPSKCQLIKYGSGYDAPFYFNDMEIKYNNKGVHLGHTIGPCVHQDMVKNLCHDFTWRLNSLVCNFGFCNIKTKRQLFISFCTSFYGVCLWNLQDKHVKEFYVTWRKGIRKLFNLPIRTHCNLLPPVIECLPIHIQIMKRMVGFIQSCLHSKTSSLRLLSHLALQGSGSYMSKTMNVITAELNIDPTMLFNRKNFHSLSLHHYLEGLDESLFNKVSFIKEILLDKENVSGSSFFTKEELDMLFSYVFTF